MKSVKNVLPPMHGVLGFLSNAFNLFLEQQQMSQRVDPPTMIPLLAGVFETAISSYCVHEETSWSYIDNRVIEIIPDFRSDTLFGEKLLEYVIDPVYTWAVEYFHEMKFDTWESWIVTIGKSGVIILQCLGDYRALEWERLVREGVITPPKHLANAKRPAPIKGHVVASRPRIKEIPTFKVRKKDAISMGAVSPLGYRIHTAGGQQVRTTIPELEAYLGMRLDPNTIAQLNTFGLVPNNHYPITRNGNMVASVEVLWREDRALEHLQLKQAVRAMNREPDAFPEIPLVKVSLLDDLDILNSNNRRSH